MDSENKFWLGLWSHVAGVVVILIAAITISSMNTNETFLKAVQAGHDPLKVTCAMGVSQNEVAMCAIIADKK